MISFYFLSERFFLKRKGLSDARVESIIKKYEFIWKKNGNTFETMCFNHTMIKLI